MHILYFRSISKLGIVKLVRLFLPKFPYSAYLTTCSIITALLVLTGVSRTVDAQFTFESQPHALASQPLSSPCTNEDTPSGTVTLCIHNPPDNSRVSGLVTVEVVLSGPEPELRRAKLRFQLNGEYILTDYVAPYIFEWPTDHFRNGLRTLSVDAELNDGTETDAATINVQIDNAAGGTSNQAAPFTPYTAPSPPSGQPLVVAATGDGASGESSDVPNLIASWNPSLFLYLGDVYEDGTYTEFYNWYGSGANYFSRFRSITNPTAGNHEYTNGEAPGYFEYWNNPPSYYSFDSGGWHFISLNSNLAKQMSPGTPQYSWLAADLAKNTSQCTLAYLHAPRYSIGSEGGTERLASIWALLVKNQVDIFLAGHDHNYQRWQPLDASGNLNDEGMTEFVVGSGGHGIRPFLNSDIRLASASDSREYGMGALRLGLYTDRASFSYINTEGVILDSGDIPCHRVISKFTFRVPSSSTANLRSCPATNCDLIKPISAGTDVVVVSQVTGDVVSGSGMWYEVTVGDLHGYIHSSLLIRISR